MKFIQKKNYVFILAGICLICAMYSLTQAEELNIPMNVGTKWIYTDHTITIMQKYNDGTDTWYGFTTGPEPESLPPEIWDNPDTWDELISNWMAVIPVSGGISVQMKDKIEDSPISLLTITEPSTPTWSEPIKAGEPDAIFTLFEEKENVAVPAGPFSDCYRVKVVINNKFDAQKESYYDIEAHTWYADGVGVVKDSTIVKEAGCNDRIHVSKLIRFVQK